MNDTQTTSPAAELEDLSMTAMEAVCQDIAGMFDVTMDCRQQNGCIETVQGLKKQYKNIAAVVSVKATGHLKGTFHLIFDREGLFTFAGIIVMQPKQKIIENRKKGTLAETDNIRDAIKEGGNLLVGSWNRVCLKKWGNNNHLIQTDMFIGSPWSNPQESIQAADNEEFIYIPCEMTIADYPAFKCGVIYPKDIQNSAADDVGEKTAVQDEKPQELAAQQSPQIQEKPAAVEKKADPAQEKPVEVKDKPVPAADTKAGSKSENKPQPKTESPAVTENKAAAKLAQEAISRLVEPSKVPEEVSAAAVRFTAKDMDLLSHLSAKDIMRKEVIWCESDESVEQVRIKMDRNDINYVLVGTAGLMEGIVSRSDLTAATSPYLRPVFAQWRRPLDEASLQIKVKWVMTRPVHIVKPEKPLTVVMETMCHFGVRALPVMDQQGKVEGLITVFDIFRALLQKDEADWVTAKTA